MLHFKTWMSLILEQWHDSERNSAKLAMLLQLHHNHLPVNFIVQILSSSNPKIQPMIPGTAPSNCKQEKHSSRTCCTLFDSFACICAAKLLNQSSSWSEVSLRHFLYCKRCTPFSSVLWQMSEFKGLSSAAMMSTAPSQKQTMPQDLS